MLQVALHVALGLPVLLFTPLRSVLPPHHAQGDAVEILIITKDGIKREEMPLKKD